MENVIERLMKWSDLLAYLQGKDNNELLHQKSVVKLHADTKKLLDDCLETWKNDVCQIIQQTKPKLIEQGELIRQEKSDNLDQGWQDLLNQMDAQCSQANEVFIKNLESRSQHLSHSEQSNLQQAVLSLIPQMNQAYSDALNGIADAFGGLFNTANSVVSVISGAVSGAISVITGLFG